MDRMEEVLRGSGTKSFIGPADGEVMRECVGSMDEVMEEGGGRTGLFGSGNGRTVRIEEREGGEVVEWWEDLTTVVLYSEIVESSGR
jgi:hypothetical protein